MIKNTERLALRNNRPKENTLNDSISSTNSFYQQLDSDSKRDIFYLINAGYNKKQIIKIYLLLKPLNVNEAILYLSEENGKHQHIFFPSKSSNNICEICGSEKNLHISKINRAIISSSHTSSISSIKINNNISIPIKDLFNEKYHCKICEDDIQKEMALKNECYDCNYYFCDECLYLDLKESIKNGKYPLYCPECKTEYDDNKINDILSKNYGNEKEKNNLLKLYEKNKFKNKILNNNNLLFCPIPDCEGYAEKNDSTTYNTCSKGHKFCIRCGEKWHRNGICPEEEKLDQLFQKYYERLHLKKCPFCQMMTIKRGGCNHINCTYCKKHWCWICGELFESVDEHYGNSKSQCYKKMNANIIETDICSKCDNAVEKFIHFSKCNHIICYNCLEQYFLENEINMNDNIHFKCCVGECKINIQLSDNQFINIIDGIGNNLLKNKYCKTYYFKPFKANKILDFFFFRNIENYNDFCWEITEFVNCMRPWQNCYHNIPCVLETLYLIWLVIFHVISFYIMPISLQICFRNLYYNFVRKIIYKFYYKILIIPLIIGEELLTIIYFVPFGVFHYFYLIINLLASIFCYKSKYD